MKAIEFDRAFDSGNTVEFMLDLDKANRPNLEKRRVTIDLPAWVVAGLDRQARHLGVTRQALIKMWIAEKLEPTA